MSSRDSILHSLPPTNPSAVVLPQIKLETSLYTKLQLCDQFKQVAESSGIAIYEAKKEENLLDIAKGFFPNSQHLLYAKTLLKEQDKTAYNAENIYQHPIDVFVCDSPLGVAENAAIWLSDTELANQRILAFYPENIVVLLSKENIVENMHYAYEQLEGVPFEYSLFMAGPSKTADIEQTLVKGAQGAKTMSIILY